MGTEDVRQRWRDGARRRVTGDARSAGRLDTEAPEARPLERGEAARSLEVRREHAAWAMHDLRSPITALQAMIEALEDGLVEPARYLPLMHQQVRMLGTLVDDVFEVALHDAGVVKLDIRDVALPDLIGGTLRSYHAAATRLDVVLTTRIDPDLPPVPCAPDKVERILLNLLENALRHTPAGGSVTVAVERAAGEVHVLVEDTGEGLPSEAVGHVFDRLWRGEATPGRVSGGAGLGLFIASMLVRAHRGRIWAENRPAGGARLAFSLPTERDPACATRS